MPIPRFNKLGLLPEGIHDSTLEEVESRFGNFQGSDRRPRLWVKFKQFFREAETIGLVTAILINGTFVTAKAAPNDIDLILVISPAHDFTRDLSAMEYNLFSAQRVKRRHGLDMLAAREDSDQYRRYLKLFTQVRLEPEQTKGIVRIRL